MLLLVLASMMACRGERGPQGPQGPAGKDGLVNFKILDFEVKQSGWSYSAPGSNERNGNYFYRSFEVPELTANIYDNGTINAYREFDTGTTNAVQHQLPLVQHVEEKDGDSMYFYTETTDYEFGVGVVTFFFYVSDFYYEVNPDILPPDMHFRVALVW